MWNVLLLYLTLSVDIEKKKNSILDPDPGVQNKSESDL